MVRTVSDLVADLLLEWGVAAIFGLPGDGIDGFVEALRKAKDRVRIGGRLAEALAGFKSGSGRKRNKNAARRKKGSNGDNH